MSRLSTFQGVAEHHLCAGCGACAYLEPERYRMVDSDQGFRRPLPIADVSGGDATVSACPGSSLRHESPLPTEHVRTVGREWGPVLELWEGWAADDEIRWRGSSGGVTTALALQQLTSRRSTGVLHARSVAGEPLRTETVLSTDRDGLLAGSGSLYAPASPCEELGRVENADGPCVVIGKPCDIAGTVAAARRRPRLAARLGLTIAVFCAGTPSSAGTREALTVMGVDTQDVAGLRYRGHGWPGEFTATTRDGSQHSLSYDDSWGAVLQKHRQWRCMICPDHTGEFADISVGDPWYRDIVPGEPGRSLVLVRTERGRRVVREAIASGAVELERVPGRILAASQPNLLQVRGSVWGRVLSMRGMGMATPRYRRLPMARAWWALDSAQKLRSTVGTARRVVGRGLLRATPVAASGGDHARHHPGAGGRTH